MRLSHALVIVSLPALLTLASCGKPGLSKAAERGRDVFFNVGPETLRCAYCHGLRYEGTKGKEGMGDLDERRPTPEKVINAVKNGIGIMPAQADKLTERQIQDVAAYVSEVAGRSK